ncbi:hypothetical protein [Polaribacter sp. Z022]|uniref:hypothetical protein n=1 Tax=Polaribacter sp. Z022 TaxID=2927125 RepID=UPI0020218CF0|nr:hypothetical protein [Polaribacter sp. Z022]MCL7752628.1 hypothetical protein [Polaribacter sp. Z022]
MKKIFLTLLLVVAFTTTYGQNKWQEKQINHFVKAAQTEYNLNDDQVKELTKFRTEMVLSYSSLQKKVKSGEITGDQRKQKGKEISKTFNRKFIKLTGKSYKDLAPFMNKLRKEIKNL